MSVAVTNEGILSQVRRAFGSLPRAIEHPYAVDHPNESILLYEGDFVLRDSAAEYPVHGRVTFDWLPTPGPRFEGTARGIFEGGLRPMTLSIPELNLVGDAHVGRLGLTSGTNSFPISGRLLGATWVGENETADEIRFLLPNFRDYFGQQVRHDAGADLASFSTARLRMVADDVIVEIDQEREYRELGAEVELQGGFLVGHLGRLTKADGSVLSREDADEILSALHFFLSFSGGVKTGPVLPIGFRGGERVWELWSTPYVSSWVGGTMSWLPYRDLRAVGRAFDGFLHRWRSDAWEEVLRYAVHWHTTANEGAGAVETGIVLSQTALELLSWALLVEERGDFGSSEFGDKKAAEKLRLLLRQLDIPVEIPDSPPALLEAKENVLKTDGIDVEDGPQLLVLVRNGIVHPKQAARQRVAALSVEARFEVKQLALWYIELAILRLCGYSGPYSCRFDRGLKAGAERETPWSG